MAFDLNLSIATVSRAEIRDSSDLLSRGSASCAASPPREPAGDHGAARTASAGIPQTSASGCRDRLTVERLTVEGASHHRLARPAQSSLRCAI